MNCIILLLAAFLASAYSASVPGPCVFVCTKDLVPVCGSDGDTYTSACDLKRVACARRSLEPLTVAHVGECRPQSHPCEFVCTLSLVPVCGSDGETYTSECDLKRVACARRSLEPLTVAHVGECTPQSHPCEFVCPLSLVPVCGSDGETYPSECDLKRVDCARRGLVKLTVAHVGECKPECNNVVCQLSQIPVCSVDGVTYQNDCELRKAECREGLSIEISHTGECN